MILDTDDLYLIQEASKAHLEIDPMFGELLIGYLKDDSPDPHSLEIWASIPFAKVAALADAIRERMPEEGEMPRLLWHDALEAVGVEPYPYACY